MAVRPSVAPVYRPPLSPQRYSEILNLTTVVLLLSAPAWAYMLLFAYPDDNALLAVAFGPPICLLNFLFIVGATKDDAFLRRIAGLGFLAKIAGAGLYMAMMKYLYGWTADCQGYFHFADLAMSDYSARGVLPTLPSYLSSGAIEMLTTIVMIVVGRSFALLTIIFAALSFWGQYFSYRALCIAVPESDKRVGSLLMFFLPTLIFWPATIGKEAVILFGLGMLLYGFARIFRSPGPGAYLLSALGLLIVGIVRPHIAAMILTAGSLAFLLGKNRAGMAGVLSKVLGLPIFLGGTYVVVTEAQQFLNVSDFGQTFTVVHDITQKTTIGGSAIAHASLLTRLISFPFVYFRPFPWEVSSIQAGIAGVEGIALLLIVISARKQIVSMVRAWRSNAYLLFAFFYLLEFAIAYSGAIGNFGIIARQRVMALPLIIVVYAASIAYRAPFPAQSNWTNPQSIKAPSRVGRLR